LIVKGRQKQTKKTIYRQTPEVAQNRHAPGFGLAILLPLVYLHGGRGAKYNSNIFTSRMSQWLFSLLFIISLTVATGDPWQGQFHGNLTIANTDLVMANYDPWQDLTIPVLDPTRACTPRSFDMSFGCVSDQQMQE